MADRLMPEKISLGQRANTMMGHPILNWEHWKKGHVSDGRRYVMGYALPPWQRGLVWKTDQMISFLESAWRGINLGTFTYNQADLDSPLNNILVDGQQRLCAVEKYLSDEFPVFGYWWSDVTDIDRRVFQMSVHFACYITTTEDEDYLRNYYNLMNFGGVAHKESERA